MSISIPKLPVYTTEEGIKRINQNMQNLKNWEYESHVSGYHDCPDIFRLNVDGNPNKKKWVLLGGSGDYAVGNFDGHQFTPDHKGTFKNVAGPVYATQSFANSPDGEKRRVHIAWFRTDWGYKKANEIPLVRTAILFFLFPRQVFFV